MGRERVYQLFEEYFNDVSLMQIWEVGSELIAGPSYEIGYKMLTETDPIPLLNEARNVPESFELFQQGVIHALKNNLEIPIPAQQFLAEFLEKPQLKPKQKSGSKTDHEFNWRLRLALLEMEAEGIAPTRSPATDPETKICGLDIVLDVLCSFDQSHEYTYDNLARRYFRTMKKYPRIPK